MRLHHLPKPDLSHVQWLGENDYIDIWYRPQKADWMSQELYDSIPRQMPIWVVMLEAIENCRVESLDIVTTFLDPRNIPHQTSPDCLAVAGMSTWIIPTIFPL